ncbi:MAG: 3-deoxy-8-phosphooctulonate synthase [Acidobacteriota bacterium]
MSLPRVKPVEIADKTIAGSEKPVFICGPCVIESREHCRAIALQLASWARQYDLQIIFKASFDKANRTSGSSYRGPGLKEGLAVLEDVRRESGLPVLTDIHEPSQAEPAAEVVDVLQIPAFLCRQTDLLTAAARTGKTLNIKKGQFLSPWDAAHVVEKAVAAGAERIHLTERGTTFGYNNLEQDMRSLAVLRSLGFPVIFDGTHSVQLPGGAGKASGGQREFIAVLARAAAGAGVDGFFFEVHEAPERALSDGPNALPLNELPELAVALVKLQQAVREAL